jgi:hypothetical protein
MRSELFLADLTASTSVSGTLNDTNDIVESIFERARQDSNLQPSDSKSSLAHTNP